MTNMVIKQNKVSLFAFMRHIIRETKRQLKPFIEHTVSNDEIRNGQSMKTKVICST